MFWFRHEVPAMAIAALTRRLCLFIAVLGTAFFAAEKARAQGVWGDKGSFPEKIVELL